MIGRPYWAVRCISGLLGHQIILATQGSAHIKRTLQPQPNYDTVASLFVTWGLMPKFALPKLGQAKILARFFTKILASTL